MSRLLGGVLLGLALLAATAGVGWTKATSVTTQGSFVFDQMVSDPCHDETIAFDGTAHFVTHVTTNDDGTVHVAADINFQGLTGVGTTSGNVYRFPAAGHFIVNFTNGASNESDLIDSGVIIGKGSADNFVYHNLFHVTRNADGPVTTEFVRMQYDCRG